MLKVNNCPAILITALVVVLFVANFTRGTYLTGWDNIHSEFNIIDNLINKSLFGVWQENYGVGAQGANAVITEIFRQPFVAVLSTFLSQNTVRYVWHFLMIYVGALGIYYLLRRFLLLRYDEYHTDLISLIGAVFYILNLGTVQNFYAPVEAFSYYFAFLPILIHSLLNLLDSPNVKSKTKFFLVNLLATPMFYFPTVFIVYLLVLGLFLLGYALSKHSLKLPILTLALVVVANIYWILPFITFMYHGGTNVVETAKTNQFFTEDAFLRNNAYGTFLDVLLLRGVWFGTVDVSGSDYIFMMQPWIDHFSVSANAYLAVVFIILIYLGIIYSFVKKLPYRLPLFLVLCLSVTALFASNPPTGFIFDFFRNHVPLFKQVFRLPFTKFVVLASFIYSFYLALGVAYLFYFLVSVNKKFLLMLTGVLVGLIVIFSLPSFKGNYIYDNLRVDLPAEYTDVFNFFKKVPSDAKIANLPQVRFYGWISYSWGYRGSGFLWYGVKQPVMDRAFDVWSSYNERYYRELSHAIYTQDSAQFEQVLEKYNIKYIWLDENVTFIDNPELANNANLKELLNNSPVVKKVFFAGKQSIYAINLEQKDQFYVAKSFQSVNTQEARPAYDIFYKISPYFSSKTPVNTYPFIDVDNSNNIQFSSDQPVLKATLNQGIINIPNPLNTETNLLALVNFDQNQVLQLKPVIPRISLDGKELNIEPQRIDVSITNKLAAGSYLVKINEFVFNLNLPLEKDSVSLGYAVINPKKTVDVDVYADKQQPLSVLNNIYESSIDNCNSINDESTGFSKSISENSLVISGKNSRICLYSPLSDLVPAVATKSILKLQVEYSVNYSDEWNLCLFKTGDSQCLKNQSYSVQDSTSFLPSTKNFYFSIDPSDIKNTNLKLELLANNILHDSSLVIKDVNMELISTSLVSISQPIENINKYLLKTPVLAGTSLEISDFYPKGNGLISDASYDPASLRSRIAQNCDPVFKNVFRRTFVKGNNEPDYIEFYSQQASSCDTARLKEILYNPGYIVAFNSMNVVGRPPVICLKEDPPGFCLVSEILGSKAKEWTKNIYILPPSVTDRNVSYSLLLDNYALGNELKINRIAKSTLYPIPYFWLKSIVVGEPVDSNVTSSSERIKFSKIAPFIYKASFAGTSVKSGDLVVLNQGFDKGWTLLGGGSTAGWEHVLVNGWANGWRVSLADGVNLNGTLVVIFWPQLLAFLGFGIILVVGIVLIMKSRGSRVL